MYLMGYNSIMRVETTKVYLDWINSLSDRAGRHAFRFALIDSSTGIRGSREPLPTVFAS